MKCHFCGAKIHFWEEFYAMAGYYFHIQFVSLNKTLRCKRQPSRILEIEEKRIEKEKKCSS